MSSVASAGKCPVHTLSRSSFSRGQPPFWGSAKCVKNNEISTRNYHERGWRRVESDVFDASTRGVSTDRRLCTYHYRRSIVYELIQGHIPWRRGREGAPVGNAPFEGIFMVHTIGISRKQEKKGEMDENEYNNEGQKTVPGMPLNPRG